MNRKKLSAVLTAALLAGALSTTALAADRLPTGDASVTFKKAIDMTDAAGAGGVLGTMTFDVTAGRRPARPAGGGRSARQHRPACQPHRHSGLCPGG